MQRHRHQEFICFLNAIGAEIRVGKALDNYAAHKHLTERKGLDRHERFVFRFAPMSCSRLDAVECFFAKLIKRRLRRAVFRSIVETAFNGCPEGHSTESEFFTRRASHCCR